MSKLLKNKTAIITGATRGIGKGIARNFAINGCNVAFTHTSSVEAAKSLEQELNELKRLRDDMKAAIEVWQQMPDGSPNGHSVQELIERWS